MWPEMPNSVTNLFMAKDWCRFLNETHGVMWAPQVRTFYGSLVRTEHNVFTAYVSGIRVPFSLDIIIQKLATKDVPSPFSYTYPNNLHPLDKDVCTSNIALDTPWATETFSMGRLSDKARLTFQIICTNILQTSNDSAMRPCQETLVYRLFDPSTPIQLGQTIYKDIFYAVVDRKGVKSLFRMPVS